MPRVKFSINPAITDDVILNYTLSPVSVFYTRDTLNPSIARLTLGVTNNTGQQLVIDGIQVKIPVSSDPYDPEALTSDPSSIDPISLQPTTWDFQKGGDGIYRAEPIIPGTPIEDKESLTFQLKNIVVNREEGTVLILITENDGGGNFPTEGKQILKIKSDLNIDKFDANPTEVAAGKSSELSWITTGAARVTLLPGDFPGIKTNDSVIVNPTSTTPYTLTAYGEGPNVSNQVTILVKPPEIVDFTASPNPVDINEEFTLEWETENGNTASITPAPGEVALIGSTPEAISGTTVFTLTVTALSNQSQNRPLTVNVNPVEIKSFIAEPSYGVKQGQEVILSWDVKSTSAVFLDPYGAVEPIDSRRVAPGNPTIYTLTAEGEPKTILDNITVLPIPLGWHIWSNVAPWYSNVRPVLVEFNNLIYAIETWDLPKVYSSHDGSSWETISSTTNITERQGAQGVIFQNKIWLMGGFDRNGSPLNDVWSSEDGKVWQQEPIAEWSGRGNFGCIVLNDKIFVMGGQGSAAFNDIWSSDDGKTWTQETNNAAWDPRSAFGLTMLEGTLYLMAGRGTTSQNLYSDVWSSQDGITWQWVTTSNEWSRRSFPNVATIGNELWLYGGVDAQGVALNDLYISRDATKWTSTTAAPTNKAVLTAGSINYQDALWLIGGGADPGYINRKVFSFTRIN